MKQEGQFCLKKTSQRKKVLAEGKEIKLSLAWKMETEWTSQEKWHLKTRRAEILTISFEGTEQDGV